MREKPDPYLVDDDNPELTSEQIRAMRPASEVLPPELYASLVARYEATQAGKVESVTIDLDPEVAAKLRATGPDWPARASAIPRKAVGLWGSAPSAVRTGERMRRYLRGTNHKSFAPA